MKTNMCNMHDDLWLEICAKLEPGELAAMTATSQVSEDVNKKGNSSRMTSQKSTSFAKLYKAESGATHGAWTFRKSTSTMPILSLTSCYHLRRIRRTSTSRSASGASPAPRPFGATCFRNVGAIHQW